VNQWQWFHDYVAEARKSGDPRVQRMLDLWDECDRSQTRNPDERLAKMRECRRLAELVGARWVALVLDHRMLLIIISEQQRYADALELAVRANLEARKPEFAGFPQRVCLQEDLVFCYLNVDPLGNRVLINEALNFMHQQLTPGHHCSFCVQNCSTEFALAQNDLEAAEQSLQRILAIAGRETVKDGEYTTMLAACDLCVVMFRRADWEGLAHWCVQGEGLARRSQRPMKVAEFLAWQAILARRAGREDDGRRLIRRAINQTKRAGGLPWLSYYEAVCGYYDLAGEYEKSFKMRGQELEQYHGKGRHYYEFQCRLHRCRYLHLLERPRLLKAEREAAQAVAHKMREPAFHLQRLNGITCGE